MALQSSGPISLLNIQTEFGGTSPISVSEYYRGGGLVPNGAPQNANIATSGAISIGSFYGSVKGFVFNQVISSNYTNYNLRTAAIAAGWDQVLPLIATITVNSNIYVSSNSTGVYAFDTGSSFPTGSALYLINNGFILGMGGAGGKGGGVVRTYDNKTGQVAETIYPGSEGLAGGAALIARYPISVDNLGTIGGGGGGGGGGQAGFVDVSGGGKTPLIEYLGGGGGGGGRTASTASSGGAGGYANYSGSSGGAGSYASAGTGGSPAIYNSWRGGYGGNGGAWGASGSNGGTSVGSTTVGPYAGGAGGAAVVGNANISWISAGTRYGAIT